MFEEIEEELNDSLEKARVNRVLTKLKLAAYGFVLLVILLSLLSNKLKNLGEVLLPIFFTTIVIFFGSFIMSLLLGMIPYKEHPFHIRRRFCFYCLLIFINVLVLFLMILFLFLSYPIVIGG